MTVGVDLLPYLVAIGAGATVRVHRILSARPIVLARAGEAGIALGCNVDVHGPWAGNQSVGGRSLSGLTVTPSFLPTLLPPHLYTQRAAGSVKTAHPIWLESR